MLQSHQAVRSGALALAIGGGSAHGQFQDTSSDTVRGYPNSRVQSNISDQGSGYSPAPYGPYGQYYSRPLPRQSKAPQRQTFGFPSPGVSLPAGESWEAWYRARRPIADWGVAWSEENGRLVATQVTEESELARAGLHAGDQLVSVSGRPITTLTEWRETTAALPPGQEVLIVVRRDGEPVTLHLTVGGRLEELPSLGETGPVQFITAARLGGGQHGHARLGVVLQDSPGDRAVVREVAKGSAADQAGLLPGDTILSLSGWDVDSPEALVRLVSQAKIGSTVELYVERGSKPGATPEETP